jgi:hypothetical protein
LINSKWFDDRLNDILYSRRAVLGGQQLPDPGRIREDNIVGITCRDLPEDEYVFDWPPGIRPLPVVPPVIPPPVTVPGYGEGSYGTGPYGGAP